MEKRKMKRVFNLLIVDESGSMSVIEREALAGINETLMTIKAMQAKYENMQQMVTLLTFDSSHLKFIYENEPANNLKPLTSDMYNPCAATPLYDAIGAGIAKVNALTTEEDSVLVTIITDGYENSSREYKLHMIKNLIAKLKKQNWTFTFIGTDNLDVKETAAAMGISNNLSFAQDEEGTKKMFCCEKASRIRYNHCLNNNVPEMDAAYFDESLHPSKN